MARSNGAVYDWSIKGYVRLLVRVSESERIVQTRMGIQHLRLRSLAPRPLDHVRVLIIGMLAQLMSVRTHEKLQTRGCRKLTGSEVPTSHHFILAKGFLHNKGIVRRRH